jgi:Cu(I)/Ag(I) efflux system membrane fusion protein
MKTILFTIVLICSLFVSCIDREQDQEMDNMNEKVHYYTCSMDPQIKEDHPGKCPICHMDLTPMKETKMAMDEIKLSKQQILLGNIQTLLIEKTAHKSEENFNAEVQVNKDNLITIASRAKGRIEKLFIKTESEYVHKNQPLYTLYSEEVAIIKKDLLTAIKQKTLPGELGENAEELIQSAKRKLSFIGLTSNQIKEIITQNEVSPITVFYCLNSGFITNVQIIEGSYVNEGDLLFQVADLSSIWLETQVNVSLIGSMKLGENVKVIFPDLPTVKMEGKIDFINSEIESSSRLVLVRIYVPNSAMKLKVGMQANVAFNQEVKDGIFLPSNALIREENASYVWVEKSEGVYQNKMVKVGQELDGWIEIKSGVEIGQKVIVSGAYAVNSEYKFRKGADPMAGHDMSNM